MQSSTIGAGNLTFRWEEAGQGVPVVMIHGIPTCPALWRDVGPRVEGARCMAWEMVGYGASIPEGEGRDISVGKQADYLVEWLRAVGVERAVLVGHDLGGGVAQIAAVRHPELCAGLLFTNAICYDSWPIPSVKAMRAAGPLVEQTPDAVFQKIFAGFIAGGHSDAEAAERAVTQHWPHYLRHGGAAAFVRQVDALDVNDTLAISDRLSDLDVPARVVWGAADTFQKLEYGERLALDLRAPIRRIDGGLHFTPEDYPEIIAEEINRLLQALG